MLSRSGPLHQLPGGVLQRWSLCLHSRPLPGLWALSCLPWPPKAKQAVQSSRGYGHSGATTQGSWAKVVHREGKCRRAMVLSQEALEGVLHGTFLEDAWPCFCCHTLTCGSKLGYYIEWSMEHKKACGDPDLPPNAFPSPLPRSADGHTRGPQLRGGLAPQEPGHSRL